uniref:Uncharacterized protein n=1 Tax=Anopheles atroparvus TaxID=41427 RepID=A0A182IQ37_ANOAO
MLPGGRMMTRAREQTAAATLVVLVRKAQSAASFEPLGRLAGQPGGRVAVVELGAPLKRGLLAHQADVPVAHRLELAVTARAMYAPLLLRSLQADEREDEYAADVHQYGAGHPKQSPTAQRHGRIIGSGTERSTSRRRCFYVGLMFRWDEGGGL